MSIKSKDISTTGITVFIYILILHASSPLSTFFLLPPVLCNHVSVYCHPVFRCTIAAPLLLSQPPPECPSLFKVLVAQLSSSLALASKLLQHYHGSLHFAQHWLLDIKLKINNLGNIGSNIYIQLSILLLAYSTYGQNTKKK